MARPSQQVIERMTEAGFVFLVDASEESGLPVTTLRDLELSKQVGSARIGRWVFLERSGLEAYAPVLFPKKKRAPRGRATKDKSGGADV